MPFLSEQTGKELSFKHHFGVPLAMFADKALCVATNKFQFDLFAFEKWLSKKHPQYDPDSCTLGERTDISMGKAIEILYSKKASELIRTLI